MCIPFYIVNQQHRGVCWRPSAEGLDNTRHMVSSVSAFQKFHSVTLVPWESRVCLSMISL